MSPRVKARTDDTPQSSLEEFRTANGNTVGPPTPGYAWWKYMLIPAPGDPYHDLNLEEQRALSKATGAAGGFLAPPDTYEEIIAAARAQRVIAALAREIVTDTGGTLPLPTAPAHGAGGWVAENAAGTPSDETFGQVELGAFKSHSKVILSEELAQDVGVPLDEYLTGELGARLATVQEAAFATGSGSGMPQGFVPNVPDIVAPTGNTAAFNLAAIKAVYMALPAAYRPRASWVFHPDDFGSLAALTDSAGGLVLPGLQQDPPVLFGRPVFVSVDMPAPAASAKSGAFGDFRSGYAIRRVRGVGITRLVELHSDNGQLAYRAVERVDGRVVIPDAIRTLQHSAT